MDERGMGYTDEVVNYVYDKNGGVSAFEDATLIMESKTSSAELR